MFFSEITEADNAEGYSEECPAFKSLKRKQKSFPLDEEYDDVSDEGRTFRGLEMDKICVALECKELWMKFHELGTEMIITKAGR